MSDNTIIYPEDERKIYPVDWKTAFPRDILETAETSRNLKMVSFQKAPDGRGFSAVIMEGRSRYTVTAKNFPQEEGRNFSAAGFSCSCQRYSYFPAKCIHAARAMMSAEKIMGPFTVREAFYKWNKRKEENRIRRLREERHARLKDPSCKSVPALSAFGDLVSRQNSGTSGIFFDFERFLDYFTTNTFYLEMLSGGEGMIEYQWIWDRRDKISIRREDDGRRVLRADAYTADEGERVPVILAAGSTGSFQCSCECSMGAVRKQKGIKNELCVHQLRILRDAWTAALEYSAGGTTDQKGKSFLSLIEKQTVLARKEESEVVQTRVQDIRIVPRITRDDSKVTLSFQIGRAGSRLYILKSYEKLIGAYEESGILSLGKNADLDFSAETFTDESQPWMTFIQRKYGEIDQANERLSRRIGYV
ncbi:MAG: SWIM zinc finger family protein, partial [bacterium]